jgi:hypothetical protein
VLPTTGPDSLISTTQGEAMATLPLSTKTEVGTPWPLKESLAGIRKRVLDRVSRREITMVEASRQLGVSRSRLYELRHAYEHYGEVGLFPKPRPRGRPRALSPALVDQIVAYAIEHPTSSHRNDIVSFHGTRPPDSPRAAPPRPAAPRWQACTPTAAPPRRKPAA